MEASSNQSSNSNSNSSCVVHVVGPSNKDLDPKITSVNTTSRSKEKWSQGLSPFFLGPVKLYGNFKATNVENAWQYCKVYTEHLDENNEPTQKYWEWAKEGWSNPKPVRFPMGKGAKPAYSLWDGQKLDYIQARKKIYAPIYAKAVVKSAAFLRLEETYKSNKEMYLWDFDGYDYLKKGMNLQQVIDDPKEKMGHSFVLLMMLKREFHWPVEEELVTILSQTDELRKQAVSNAEESEKMKRIEIEQKRKERQNKRNNAELE